ncbi:transcriptional regulator [Nocardiopsis sp. N85]|uniref:transcriptional regulator n=1 Tax=Nocardiopsis sp. N85 TaxID=3029400 RepID=UPI00237F08C3|nr:transcriptional regulator [Nocardiopsis sp. N85]MDE3720329.1 transcriptional regulator [Nocardiopsis sp. N85]
MYSSHIRRSAVSMLDTGLSQAEVSRSLGISCATLRSWSRNRSLIEKYRDNGECPRCEPIPRPPTDLRAYGHLLGLYLGDGTISPTGDGTRGVWRLRVSRTDMWPGLMDECAVSMGMVLPGHSIGRAQRTGCTEVYSDWKHWPCLFPQHGPGKKHERTITLEPWQREIVRVHPEEFVKGLIHSDGWRGINRVRRLTPEGWRYHEYPRYEFVNASRDIVDLFTDALDLLEIPWRVRVQRRPPHRDKISVSVARRDAVARLDTFVGPKS